MINVGWKAIAQKINTIVLVSTLTILVLNLNVRVLWRSLLTQIMIIVWWQAIAQEINCIVRVRRLKF
ncbi:hypothetical protein H6G36_20650 [Anabaena minutissima FACHB-250]|nr:hypothetical protein [Anabaena minutissima FACHB-250]